jgi:hypothetical protein
MPIHSAMEMIESNSFFKIVKHLWFILKLCTSAQCFIDGRGLSVWICFLLLMYFICKTFIFLSHVVLVSFRLFCDIQNHNRCSIIPSKYFLTIYGVDKRNRLKTILFVHACNKDIQMFIVNSTTDFLTSVMIKPE